MPETKIMSDAELAKTSKEGLQLVSPLQSQVNSVKVTTELEYMKADSLLTKIRIAKANWLNRINPIIEPSYKALQLLYKLRSDVVEPLEKYELSIKGKMKDFKLLEARIAREAEEKRQAEIRRIEEEERLRAEAEAKARTSPMKARLAEKRAELEAERLKLENTVAASPIQAAGSTPKATRKWKVVSITKLMEHLIENEDLTALVIVDQTQMNAYFKLEKPGVGKGWLPGIEVYDDIDITWKAR